MTARVRANEAFIWHCGDAWSLVWRTISMPSVAFWYGTEAQVRAWALGFSERHGVAVPVVHDKSGRTPEPIRVQPWLLPEVHP